MEHKKLAGSHATYISSDFIFIALNKTASCTSEKREKTSIIRFPFISLNPYCCHKTLFICLCFKRNVKVLKKEEVTFKNIIQYPNDYFIIINMSILITKIFHFHAFLTKIENIIIVGTILNVFFRISPPVPPQTLPTTQQASTD